MTLAVFGIMIGIMWFLVGMGYFIGRQVEKPKFLAMKKIAFRDAVDLLNEKQRVKELLDMVVTVQAARANGTPLAVLNATIPRMRANVNEDLNPHIAATKKPKDAEPFETVEEVE